MGSRSAQRTSGSNVTGTGAGVDAEHAQRRVPIRDACEHQRVHRYHDLAYGRLCPTEGRDIRGLSQLAYLGYGLVRRPTGMIPVPVDGTSRDTESRFRPTRRDLGTE